MTDKIPFDVEKWKSGKYDVVDGRGTAVKSLLIHDINCNYPVSVVLENNTNESYRLNGWYDNDQDSEYNLFLTPKKRKVWIAVAKDAARNGIVIGCAVPKETKKQLLDYTNSDDYYHIEVELPE